MTTPTTGAISIQDLVDEFGRGSLTTPPALQDYYRAGGLVPSTTAFSVVPVSGLIGLQSFYGLDSGNIASFIVATQTGGTVSDSGNFRTITWAGGGTFTVGSLGNNAGSNSLSVTLVGAGGGGRGGGRYFINGEGNSDFDEANRNGGNGGASTISLNSTVVATGDGGDGGTSAATRVQQSGGAPSNNNPGLTNGDSFSGGGFTGTGGAYAPNTGLHNNPAQAPNTQAPGGNGTGVASGGGGGLSYGASNATAGGIASTTWSEGGDAGSLNTATISPALANSAYSISIGTGGAGGQNLSNITGDGSVAGTRRGGNGAPGRVSITYQFQGPQYVGASGGVVSVSGDYRTHTFSSGISTLTINNPGNAVGSNTLSITSIGAGGGGKGANNVSDNQCKSSYPDPNGGTGGSSTAVLKTSADATRSTTTGAGGPGGNGSDGSSNQTSPNATRRGDNFSGGGFTGTGGNGAHFATTISGGNNTLIGATNGTGYGAGGGGGARQISCSDGDTSAGRSQYFEGGDAGSLTTLATSLALNTGDKVDITVGDGGAGGGNGNVQSFTVSTTSDPILSAATRKGGSGSDGVVTITYKFQN